jgi:hypothetical protein
MTFLLVVLAFYGWTVIGLFAIAFTDFDDAAIEVLKYGNRLFDSVLWKIFFQGAFFSAWPVIVWCALERRKR